MFKAAIHKLTRALVVRDPVWGWLGNQLQKSGYLQAQRQARTELEFTQLIKDSNIPRQVLAGPFKGLRYSKAEALGSALWPKLLGTYEQELHSIIDPLLERPYRAVIDWGCAEGYYLVGFGRAMPDTLLIGVDPSEKALRRCREMATDNGIDSQRLKLFPSATLSDFPTVLNERTLIISDCEGFENELFGERTSLSENADLIIECHDHLVAGTTKRLTENLSQTHKITLVSSTLRSLADVPKAAQEVLGTKATAPQIERILCEGRPSKMIWIVAEAKRNGE